MDAVVDSAEGGLGLLPPPPAYSAPRLDHAYAASDAFSPRAMRPLYGATRALTQLLLPAEAAPPGVLEVTAGGSLALRGPPEEAAPLLVAHYAWPLALAAVALLLAVLLPLAGFCVSCARCCCPSPPPPPPRGRKAKRRAACRRAFLGLALAAIATAMLFGVVCAFVTNEYMQEGSDALPERLSIATNDAHLYLNNTRHHLSHLLVTNFRELRDNLEHSLNITGKLIVTGLKTLSNATIFNNVANLTLMLDSTQKDLHSLQNLTNDAHSSARVLDKELRNLRSRVRSLHARCRAQEQCLAALNASKAATDEDFLQLAAAAEASLGGGGGGGGSGGTEGALAEAARAAEPLRRSVAEAEASLAALAARVDERVASAAPSLRAALVDLGAEVADYDGELARALRNVSRALDDGADPALSHMRLYLSKYSRYRYYADAGCSAALLLIVLLISLGLLFGCCGRGGDMGGDGDCCARNTGARCLRLGIAAIYLLSAVLAVAAAVHLLAGLLAHQAVCAPMRPSPRPSPFLAIASARLMREGGDDGASRNGIRDGARLADALRRCHYNASAYTVLGLSSRRDAAKLLELGESQKLRGRLSSLRDALPKGGVQVRLLTPEARERLQALGGGAGDAAETAAQAAAALADAAARADLDALAARLDAVPPPADPADDAEAADVRADLRALASDLRRVQRGPLQDLRVRARSLNSTAARVRDRLRLGQSDARLAAAAAVRQLDAAQNQLDEAGNQMMEQLADALSNEVQGRLRAHLRRVVVLLEGHVGACAPLSRALNASLVAVCDELLLPVNGWWVGCGLCLVLFIPALIVASCLARQYSRPRADHYIPAGPDTEYLYDAYSDRDNIPLASAGKKRGPQRRFHEGYHDNAAGGGSCNYEYDPRREEAARYSDMAPKHWDLQSGAPPPRYLGPEYERPPPYYYPGPENCAGRR